MAESEVEALWTAVRDLETRIELLEADMADLKAKVTAKVKKLEPKKREPRK